LASNLSNIVSFKIRDAITFCYSGLLLFYNPTGCVLKPNTYFAPNDFVLLRFADIKLMYAEAQNEAAGPDATV
jgi:hypothetical protein